jgi:signal transduction histidine kinase
MKILPSAFILLLYPSSLISGTLNPMTTEKVRKEAADQTDIWERLGWIWSAIFYFTLLLSLYLALGDPELSSEARAWVIGGTIFLALWHGLLILYISRVPAFRWQPIIPLIYLLVTLAVQYILVGFHPAFYFVLFSLYAHIFALLPLRLAIPLSLILSVLIGYSQSRGQSSLSLTNPLIWIYLALGVVGVIFSLWLTAIINQSARRRELIAELQQAQAERAEAERNAGMLAERQRLAREIHDTLAQGFTSIVMHLEAAEQALPNDPDTVQRHLDQSRRIARDSLEQARQVVNDLRPDLLQREPFPHAIERVVRRWSEESGIVVESITTGEPYSLHPQVEVTLLRATQEALSNVRKHAQAKKAAVTLSYMDDMVVLDVQDDGIGLNGRKAEEERNRGAEEERQSSGFGLKAMRERVGMLNGSLLVESTPGEGTTLVVEIPTGQVTGGK